MHKANISECTLESADADWGQKVSNELESYTSNSPILASNTSNSPILVTHFFIYSCMWTVASAVAWSTVVKKVSNGWSGINLHYSGRQQA